MNPDEKWSCPLCAMVVAIAGDAVYEHFEDEHPVWLPVLERYDEYDLLNQRLRRVETVDLLNNIPLPKGIPCRRSRSGA